MTEIPNINIKNVEIHYVRIPSWMMNQPHIPSAPPVTVQVGVPVIDIPGCVEAHIDNKKGTNDKLVEDDSDGARVFCCLLYTSPSPRDQRGSRMPSSA